MPAEVSLRGATVLVTGGHGFMGRAVVRELDRVGAAAVCPRRPGSPHPRDLPGSHPAVDLLDTPALTAALRDVDLVVHLAARSGGIQFQESEEVDVFGANHAVTRSVLDASRAAGVRRVFLASSGVVYSGAAGELIGEHDQLASPNRDRVSGYAWSKLTDELLGCWFAAAGAFEVVAGRFANVYGPGGSFDPARSTVVHALVRKAVEAAPGGRMRVWGDGTAVRSFLHVEDAGRAVVTVLARGVSTHAYNLDGSQPVTIAELATAIRDEVDPAIALEFDRDRPQGPARRVLDSAELRALGWAPTVSLADGIRSTVAAYRATVASKED